MLTSSLQKEVHPSSQLKGVLHLSMLLITTATTSSTCALLTPKQLVLKI